MNLYHAAILAVWLRLSGNALASINVVALRQTRLLPGWVIVCGRVTISVCNQLTRSTQPFTLRGTVNEYQLSDCGDGGCRLWQPVAYRRTHRLSRLAWSWVGGRLALFYIHQMNRVNSRNGSAMMTAP